MPWFNCQVTQTGPAEDGSVYVGLWDDKGSFKDRWFKATDKIEKEILATALTAMSTGFKVAALVEAPAQYSELKRLYLVK